MNQPYTFKDPPKVPCRWCKNPTPMTGTKECDNCWEVRHRLGTSRQYVTPEILAKMCKDVWPNLVVTISERKK